jgi:hypothetical protein
VPGQEPDQAHGRTKIATAFARNRPRRSPRERARQHIRRRQHALFHAAIPAAKGNPGSSEGRRDTSRRRERSATENPFGGTTGDARPRKAPCGLACAKMCSLTVRRQSVWLRYVRAHYSRLPRSAAAPKGAAALLPWGAGINPTRCRRLRLADFVLGRQIGFCKTRFGALSYPHTVTVSNPRKYPAVLVCVRPPRARPVHVSTTATLPHSSYHRLAEPTTLPHRT